MQLRSTTSEHEHPFLRQLVRVTTVAGLFAFLVCLGSLLCTSAQASTEPPPVTESALDVQETASERDDERTVAPSRPRPGHSGASVSSSEHARLASDRHRKSFRRLVQDFANAGTFAAIISLCSLAPSLSLASVVTVDARPCLAQTFLAPVRPRGPTVLS